MADRLLIRTTYSDRMARRHLFVDSWAQKADGQWNRGEVARVQLYKQFVHVQTRARMFVNAYISRQYLFTSYLCL